MPSPLGLRSGRGVTPVLNPVVSTVYNPAVLNLSLWYKGVYGGAPWAANASAGASLANGNAVVGVAPAVGAALNGITPADFNGTTQYLTNATDAATLFSVSAKTILALIWVDTTQAATGNVYDDAAVYVDGNADTGLTVTTSGGSAAITGFVYDGAYKAKSINIGLTGWHLVMFTHDGVNLNIQADSVAPAAPVAAGASAVMTGTAQFGEGYVGLKFFDGRIMELMTANVVLSAADYANIKSYVNSVYALAL